MHRFGTPILGSTYLLTFSHFRNCNSCQLQSLIETTFGNDGYTPLIAYRIMSNTLNYKLTSIVQLLLTKTIVHHIHNEFVALCTCAVSLVILVSVVLFSIENQNCTNNYWQCRSYYKCCSICSAKLTIWLHDIDCKQIYTCTVVVAIAQVCVEYVSIIVYKCCCIITLGSYSNILQFMCYTATFLTWSKLPAVILNQFLRVL